MPDEALGLCVQADRQRLKQVLLNLLSNAIKYNRRGGDVTIAGRDLPSLRGWRFSRRPSAFRSRTLALVSALKNGRAYSRRSTGWAPSRPASKGPASASRSQSAW